jgi:hypothetical protein
MSGNFTQGPWHWDGGELFSDGSFLVMSIGTSRSGAARIYIGSDDDASLIASAPELYEALQNMLGAFDNPIARRRMGDDEFAREAILSARAALDKAQGSQIEERSDTASPAVPSQPDTH